MTRGVSRTWKREMTGRGRHAGSQRIERLSTTYCCRIDDFQLWGWKKTLESPLNSKEIKSVNPKGNQPWVFIGRTDAKAEIPILGPPDVKNWLIGKDPDAGKDKAGREGDNRGWHGWMASSTQWTWVWANSGRWRRTGKPGMLQSMGSQSQTWLSNWTELIVTVNLYVNPVPSIIDCSVIFRDTIYTLLPKVALSR